MNIDELNIYDNIDEQNIYDNIDELNNLDPSLIISVTEKNALSCTLKQSTGGHVVSLMCSDVTKHRWSHSVINAQ